MISLPAQVLDVPQFISDTVLALDGEWRLVYLNRAALELAGRPERDLLGRVIWDLYPALLGTPIEAAYRRAMAERTTATLEAPGVVSGRWYDIHIYPADNGLVVYGRDVTQRKRAELALRESEERFRAQYEGLPVPTYTWRASDGDAGAGAPDLTLISFNAAASRFTRGEVARLVGSTARTLYGHSPTVLRAMLQCLGERRVVRHQISHRMVSTGDTKELDVTYAFVPPDLVMVHTEDVTDRLEAERALRRSELRYRALAEASPVGIYHTDVRGRCLYVNARWSEITGVGPAQAQGDDWAAAVHPDDRARVVGEWRAAARAGTTFGSEYRVVRPDGSVSWVFGQAAAERDAAGEAVGVVGTITDITGRKRTEQELAALNASLERRVAERTAALLARSAALEAAEAQLRSSEQHYRELAEHNRRLTRELEHRVGNHLAGLLALVREMRGRRADGECVATALEGRLVSLAHVHRLLATVGWRRVGLDRLVGSLTDALRSTAPRSPCPVALDLPAGVTVDGAQATALAMILTEWFTNSCKHGAHSAAAGRVELSGGHVPGGRDPAAAAAAAGDWLALRWRERGGPPIAHPVVPSLGTELVHGFASRELRGRCTLSYPADGADHLLEFPVPGDASLDISHRRPIQSGNQPQMDV